jgi:LPXTG-motif cell wall-anchored protein
VPTLDGAGLASLAGVLTMTGAWVLARRRSKKR